MPDRSYDDNALAQARAHERKFDDDVARLKPQFGVWDPFDPVVLAILKLVEAQTAVTAAISDSMFAEPDPEHADIRPH